MDLWEARSICLSLLFLLPMILGTLPISLPHLSCIQCIPNPKDIKRFLSFLNCFAGGFFLGTSLVVVLVQGFAMFEQYRHMVNLPYDLPLFEVGIGVGFFIVALTEKLLHIAYRKTNSDGENLDGEMSVGNNEEGESCGYHSCIVALKSCLPGFCLEKLSSLEETSCCYEELENERPYEVLNNLDPASIETIPRSSKVKLSYSQNQNDDKNAEPKRFQHGAHDGGEITPRDVDVEARDNDATARDDSEASLHEDVSPPCNDVDKASAKTEEEEESVGENQKMGKEKRKRISATEEEEANPGEYSFLRVVLLLIALSFHTIFDGLALGLLLETHQVFELTVALSVHKIMVSIVLGAELGTVFYKPTTTTTATTSARSITLGSLLRLLKDISSPLLCLTFYASACPLGGLIGIGVTSSNVYKPTELLVGAILQAVATGVFLYVTCFEILQKDMVARRDHSVMRVLTAICGFASLISMQVFMASVYSPGDGGEEEERESESER